MHDCKPVFRTDVARRNDGNAACGSTPERKRREPNPRELFMTERSASCHHAITVRARCSGRVQEATPDAVGDDASESAATIASPAAVYVYTRKTIREADLSRRAPA